MIFGDAELNEKKDNVHIRVHQRTARSHLTSIQGLNKDLDLKLILKALKKKFATNGTIVKKEETNESVIQLQGDIGEELKKYLVDNNICSNDGVKVHGC
jgi:translation initiation factor 1